MRARKSSVRLSRPVIGRNETNAVVSVLAGGHLVQEALRRAGIETTFGTHCVPMLGWYRRTFGFTAKSFPNAWRARDRSLTLPLCPGMDPASQSRVICVLEEVLG